MRNLRRRIEALERSRLVKVSVDQTIARHVVESLWLNDVESLIAAYAAERVGRELSEGEVAAKRTYREALEREWRWERVPPIPEADCRSVITYGIAKILACRIWPGDLELCRSGICAAQQGREASDRESAALETYRSEKERISRMAGFASVAELNAFCSPEHDSEREALDEGSR